MVKSVSKRVARLLLSFAVPTEDRMKAFTKEMEMAAILCLVESERDKGGGFISKRVAEEIGFVAEACYPLWLIPWGKRNLLFDGLNIITHKLSYDVLPDVQAFADEVGGSGETRETYSVVLSDYFNYFQGFTGKEEKAIDGLITSSDFIQDFMFFLPEAKAIRKPMTDKIILSPALDKSAVSSSVRGLSDLSVSLKRDVGNLREAMKLLSTATKKRVSAIRGEIRKTQKEFNKKIARVKSSVAKKRREIKRKYDQGITNLSRTFEQQLQNLHQERVKAEKDKQRLTVEIDRCEAELRSSRIRKDEVGELQWRQRIKEHRKMLPTLDKKIKDVDKRIKDINAAKTLELSKLRAEYDAQVEAALADLREVEASREAETRMRQQEVELLEERSSMIINKVDKLMKLKEAAIKEIEGMGMPKSRRRYALIYLPFYLACYRRDMKKRYVVYPPSIVGGMGMLTKFKGVFGSAKIKSLLRHRSKPITNFLNQITPLIMRNPVFEKETSDAGTQANILRTKESLERIKKGLEELKSEEWISESEFLELKSIVSKS